MNFEVNINFVLISLEKKKKNETPYERISFNFRKFFHDRLRCGSTGFDCRTLDSCINILVISFHSTTKSSSLNLTTYLRKKV